MVFQATHQTKINKNGGHVQDIEFLTLQIVPYQSSTQIQVLYNLVSFTNFLLPFFFLLLVCLFVCLFLTHTITRKDGLEHRCLLK